MTHSQRTRRDSAKAPLLFLIIAALAGSPSPSAARSSYPDLYDAKIRSAVKTYWADYPIWLMWKSQLWQESHLDPEARSGVGAVGLAQFMSPTWNDVLRQLNLHGDRNSAELSIQAGAYYMATLRQQWRRDRTGQERHDLALSSYNAGLGNTLRAQKLCDNGKLWQNISPCLSKVTGPTNAKQTTDYVTHIYQWWRQMELER